MSRDTTVIPFRQPDAVDDPLAKSHVKALDGSGPGVDCRSRRLCSPVEGLEISRRPRPRRASRPWTAARHPDRSWACRGPARQSARPGRRGPPDVGIRGRQPACSGGALREPWIPARLMALVMSSSDGQRGIRLDTFCRIIMFKLAENSDRECHQSNSGNRQVGQ